MKTKPTPTPWKWKSWGEMIHIEAGNTGLWINPRGDSSKGIPSKEDKEMANKIVRAVNAYERDQDFKKELINTLHHLLNKPELLTDYFYRKQVTVIIEKAEGK